MRRIPTFVLASAVALAAASCTDVTRPTQRLTTESTRYQLTQSGTLASEITALIQALFPQGLETAAGTRWDKITGYVSTNDAASARARLLDLAKWVKQKQSLMDPPPGGESKDAAAARLILYMSLYVYNGPNTPVPSSMATGADAVVAIVSPDSQTVVQTPLQHAGARFDAGTVSSDAIVVISQNTTPYAPDCNGPFTTKYCQYPLFYHYQVFPQQTFLKAVHLAVCHVHDGNPRGPLAGIDHDEFVLAHDKPDRKSVV